MNTKSKIKQSPKLPAEKRQQQLLKAAKKLFIKKGYRGTTTEEIARAARLTKGALYYHFASKEDILMALLQVTHRKYGDALKCVCRPGAKPIDLLGALLGVHQRDDFAEFRNMMDLWVQAMRVPKIKKKMDIFIDDAVSSFAENLDPVYGKDKASRYQLAVMIGSLYDGLAVRKSLNPQAVDVKAQLKLFELFQSCLEARACGKGKGGRDGKK